MYSHGSSQARGTAVLIKNNINTTIHGVKKDAEGRYIIIDLIFRGIRCILCNVYAPNDDNDHFFVRMFQDIQSFENSNIIVAGDFNTVFKAADKRGNNSIIRHPKCVQVISDFMETCACVDVWRLRNPNTFKFTWFRKSPNLIMERLDYILVSSNLTAQICDADIDCSFMSDHGIPHVTFVKPHGAQGPGFWHLDCTLLENTDYVQEVKAIIEDCCNKYSDIGLRWEMIKMEVRGFSIRFKARKNKSNKNKLEALYAKQAQIQKDLEACDITGSLWSDHDEQLTLIAKDIEELIAEKAKKASFSNKCRWYQHGEKNTSYFFNLESTKKRDPIGVLQVGEKFIRDNNAILCELQKFYQKLFRSEHDLDHHVDSSFLEGLNLPTLSEEQTRILDEPLLLAEVEIAINQLKKEKCPGIDGLPIEFYVKFLPNIKHVLHSMFLAVISGHLKMFPESCRTGIVSLLEKKGKDQLFIENWRPLTLLCCDYKILSKAISNRIETVIHELIHSDQTGFLKGRSIGHNLMELNTTLMYAEHHQLPMVLLSFDFYKGLVYP